jgi:hypothetical protein
MKVSKLIKLESYYPNYDPYMQLDALELMVSTLREQSILLTTNIDKKKDSGFYHSLHPSIGDLYADDCSSSAYFDAFKSSSIAACLAQYIESVLRYEINYFCFTSKGKCQNEEHLRTQNLDTDQFWNVSDHSGPRSPHSSQI